MKRLAVLVASLLALNQLLISKSKNLNECCGLVLTSFQNVSSKNQHHYSHGSASHYSAVQYVKKINKNDISKIILKPDIISDIQKLIEKNMKLLMKGVNVVKYKSYIQICCPLMILQ